MNTLRMMVWLGIFWALTPITAWAQFTDDFTDGDFTNAPTWQGDATHFQVNTLQQLWLNAPAVTATSHLTTSSNAISNATFQFEVQLDFDPSTSNYARVYLASNSSNLLASLTGYFVQIGGASGTVDDVSLYYQSGTNVTKIIDGIDGTVATSPHAVVQVTRSAMGTWELLLDTALNGSFVSQGTVTHTLSTTSQFFGVFCKYTSTRSDKFFFDNFTVTGGPTTDTTPPVVTSVTPLNNTQITVTFNEAVEAISAQNTLHYSVNSGIGNPTNAVISSNNEEVVLTFGALQANTPYTLSVDQISDLAGNTLTLQTVNFMISGGTTHFGDVVINEIFADPTPSVGLPEAEFIELYNSTNAPINLQGWVYADASSSVVLPNYILGSQDYVVLCKATDTTLFQPFGAVIGLSSWPSLNNAGDQLGLRNNQMLLIDSVNYTDSWYQDGAKSAGGWTLERINPTAPCSDQTNWIAALLPPGGTPGTQNSAFNNTPNITALQVAEVTVLSQNALTIQFNAAVDTTNITANQFVVSPTTAIANIQVNSLTQIDLTLASNLDSATIYQLLVSGITNCYGQPMADTSVAIAIGITPMAGD